MSDDVEGLVGGGRRRPVLERREKYILFGALGFVTVLLFVIMLTAFSINASIPDTPMTTTTSTTNDPHGTPARVDRASMPQCQPWRAAARRLAPHTPVLLRNAHVLVGDRAGTEIPSTDVLLNAQLKTNCPSTVRLAAPPLIVTRRS